MFSVICSELSAIFLFFYAIHRFSKVISRNNIHTLKKILAKITNKPLKSLFVGLSASAVMQSNQAISSIALMFVSTGIISTFESLPIMLGTIIGTASTAFLVSFKIENIGEIFIIIGTILKLTKRKNTGHIIFYFGLLLFSLDLMANALESVKDVEKFKKVFLFTNNSFILFLIGTIASFITQGAFVVGVLTILVSSDVLPIHNACAMSIGVSFGSTLFICVAVFSMNKEAKKAWLLLSILVFICSLLTLLFLKLFVFIGNIFESSDFGFAVANLTSRTSISLLGLYICNKFLKNTKLNKKIDSTMNKISKEQNENYQTNLNV